MQTNVKAANFWNRISKRYAKKAVPNEEIYQRKVKITQEYLSFGDAVLEFGCGTGSTAIMHASKVERVDATDISPAMIEIAKERASTANVSNVSFEVGALEDFNFKPDSYNAVLGLNVMHLIENPSSTLTEIHRVLREGGVFVSSTPLIQNEFVIVRWLVKFVQFIGLVPKIHSFTREEYLDLFSEAGFDAVFAWTPSENSIFVIAKKLAPKD